MEILFVVDSIKDLDRKISLITDTFGVNIKFFVSAKHVKDLAKNKDIVGKIASIYSSSVNVAIDQYLKSNVYTPKPTILYVSSAELTTRVIEGFRENLKLAPHTIYLKKTCTWWDRFKLWFYKKVINTIFGMKDEFASVKLQYFSAEVMSELAETNFRNHIFSLENSLTIEVSEEEAKSHYYGFKFNKRLLLNNIKFNH